MARQRTPKPDPPAPVRARAAALLAAIALGCSAEGGGTTPLASATLGFDPGDGSTARSTGVVVLTLADPAHIVDEAFLADLAGRIVVETWPEGQAIPFATQAADGAPAQKLVTVTPQQALDDRWYLTGLASVPRAVLPLARLPDGRVGTRFRPGSHPRVASVQLCPVDATSVKLLLGCSEPVTFARAPEEIVSLSVAGAASSCVEYGAQGDTFLFTCGVPAAATSAVVSVGDGVAGATGVAMDPGSWTVALPAPATGGCVELRPPI